jgi:PAS domain S-box-containing protein
MEGTEPISQTGTSKTDVIHFKESFETFNKIINNLQRQYLSLETEYGEQGRRLEEINKQLRQTISDNREVTSFLNSILTSLTSGVVAVDRNGLISHFNPAAERITGVAAEKALGKKYDEVMSARTGGRYSALDTVMSGVEFDSEEKTIINSAGEEIPVSVSTSLLQDSSLEYSGEAGTDVELSSSTKEFDHPSDSRLTRPQPCGAVEIFFDLTKIKKLEAEMNRIQTLAALGEMAATVAHEVRNPLGGIGGFACLLRREVENDEAKLKWVDKIIAGVESLNRTVTALLDYTRRDQLNLRKVSLTRLIEDSAEFERTDGETAASDITIDVEIEDNDLRVTCDPHLMRQVLLNLLRNSREAMPHGGRVVIRAGLVDEPTEEKRSSPGTWITIEDTGEGIPEDARDKIFRPFFSTKTEGSGSGLGLACVWKIIQSHQGTITVDSEVGRGTIFTIVLPSD